MTKSWNFLNVDWFPPADASLKRVVIQRLIYDLLEQPSHEAPSMTANDDDYCNLSSPTTNIHEGTAVNFFPDMCEPSTACQSSQADRGIEISLLPSLSITSESCAADPSVSLKPRFEPGSFLGIHLPSFNETTFDEYKSSLPPPIEEDVETGGQFVYSPTETARRLGNGITPEVCVVPYSSQDLESRGSWLQNNFRTSPETSISRCEDPLEVINGSNQIDAELSLKDIRCQPKSSSMEPAEMLDGNANANGDSLGFFSQCSEIQANGAIGSDESSGLESDVQHRTKKMRTTEPPLEGGSSVN